jgi:hypothetical protein
MIAASVIISTNQIAEAYLESFKPRWNMGM